jgi:tetratricopeptide (TPR) repeat protein
MSLMSKLQDELAIARREKDPRSEKNILRQMAELYAQSGEWNRWLACEEQALPLARSGGSPQEVIEILCNIGAAYTDANRPTRATSHLEEALRLARSSTLHHHEAAVLSNLARALSLTDIQKSLKTYDDALHAAKESGSRDELAMLPGAMWAAHHAGQAERAIIYAKQGVKSARKVQDRAAEGHFLLELGLLLMEQNAIEDAARCLKAARPLLHMSGANGDLARCDAATEKLPGPAKPPVTTPSLPKLPDEGLTAPSQRLNKNPRDVLALVGRAEAYLSNGQFEQALQDVNQARQIIETEPHLQVKIRQNLLERLEMLGEHIDAAGGRIANGE